MRAVLAASLILPALLPIAAAAQGGPPPPPVRVAEARVATLAPSIQVPATVISRNDARIAAEVSGRLTTVAEIGTAVKKGEPVALIDDAELELQRQEFAGMVAREESRRGFLEREVERLRSLAAQNVAAKNQLDQFESDLAGSVGSLAMARAQLGRIEVQLARTRLRAPFPGVVTERYKSPGEHTDVGDEIVHLVDPDSLEVVARAPLASLSFVRADAELEVHGERHTGTGKVRTLVPFGDTRSHLFELRVVVSADHWQVGENVRLSVPTSEPEEVLAVPRDALVLRRDGTSVFRLGEGDTVEQLDVVAGLGSGELVAVTGPLAAGDRVVVRGAERLRPGQAVRVIPAEPETQAGSATGTPTSR
jgi:RND family efflux transporter MFP subunit